MHPAAGYVAFVLHAHLPYVRHPEHDRFLEERWFFEALTETYLPLLRMLERLEDDDVDYALPISLSPTLVTMFEDELLQQRYAEHLRRLPALAEREIRRHRDDPVRLRLAEFYADRFRDALYWFETVYERRPAAAFARLAAAGRLELMTCAATHGFLPLLQLHPGAVRAQIRTAQAYHTEVFGAPAEGMWLPECAYYPGVEDLLAEAGIRYFFLDAAGFERAAERPLRGVHAPLLTRAGVAAFARDGETAREVWAAESGYPGHPDYREYYRDIGFELPPEAVRDFLIADEVRTNTGMKYCRITGSGEEKDLYDADRAREQAALDAGDFLAKREAQVAHLAGEADRPPLIVAPFDAELFGHWWYEGPLFLDYAIRKIACDSETVKLCTPRQYLQAYPENQLATPAASSWGPESSFAFWLNESNEEIYPELHDAAERLGALAGGGAFEAGEYRVLQQMARELLLAQASDWPFIMRTGTSPAYARKRVAQHLARFRTLEAMLRAGEADEETLSGLEYVDKIFPRIEPAWFAPQGTSA